MKQIKVAVLGYGIRGKKMARLISDNFKHAEIIAVCDISKIVLENCQEDFPKTRIFTDFDTMLEKTTIDVLLVETPAPFHAEYSIEALRRNIHVLCDVPAVDSYEESVALWNAHIKSKAIFMLQATTNMYGYIEKTIQLKEEGFLGEPYLIEAEYIHNLSEIFGDTPWRENYENIKYCTHCLGPSLMLIDENLKSVTCFDTGSHIDKISGRHDAMVALFKTENNVVIKLLISFVNHCPAHGQRFKIYGTKGYLERTANIEGEGSGKTLFYSPKLYDDEKLHELNIGEGLPHNKGTEIGNHGGANYELLNRFFHAIENNLPSPVSLKESLRMSIPGIFAAKSAKSGGQMVEIKYPWE